MATAVSTDCSPDRSTELSSATNALQWRQIGDYYELRKRKCQRVHSKKGKYFDLGLFYKDGKFYAMTAWCSHMGGPLYNGEIEDYNGSAHIMCPWHGYMFDLETGKNEIGIRQDVHPVKVEKGQLYIQYETELSLHPFL
ncbi:Rieske domain-containing protein-like [Liolophura sinensis]|uniref:Rieske domain-containing protein-like n=1 Tax=Liolophura sinensis TaxID=3198878 RepID=UPI003158BF63